MQQITSEGGVWVGHVDVSVGRAEGPGQRKVGQHYLEGERGRAQHREVLREDPPGSGDSGRLAGGCCGGITGGLRSGLTGGSGGWSNSGLGGGATGRFACWLSAGLYARGHGGLKAGLHRRM